VTSFENKVTKHLNGKYVYRRYERRSILQHWQGIVLKSQHGMENSFILKFKQ